MLLILILAKDLISELLNINNTTFFFAEIFVESGYVIGITYLIFYSLLIRELFIIYLYAQNTNMK